MSVGIKAGLAAVCLTAAASVNVFAQDAPKDQAAKQQLESLQGDIKETRERQKTLESRHAAIQKELSHLQLKLVRAANLIQGTEEKASELEARVAALKAEVAVQTEALGARNREIAATLGALQKIGRQPPELVFLRPDDALNTARSARLLATVMPVLRQEAEALRQDLALFAQLKAELDGELAQLGDNLAKLERERGELDGLLAERKNEQKKLQAETANERQRLTRYAAEAATLEALIKDIEADLERRRKAAEDAERRLTKRPEPSRAVAVAPPPAPSGKAFREAEGTLPLPVRGQILFGFGENDELGSPSKGIAVAARPNAQVVTPANGQVVFAGPFRDYGQILIIAHGGGYHTLLAGMTRISAVVGQSVLAGEPVGQMGDGPDPASSTVRTRFYMELRSNGKPINPLRWLAAGKGKVRG